MGITMVLKDSCGRPLFNLRIAVTNRCNLKCPYCHGEGEDKLNSNSSQEMATDEIIRIARIAVGLGISKIKLTGGEPLVRGDISEITKGINRAEGLRDLSMTTNGTLLAPLAERLYAGGLKRVNISLPTLDEKVYYELTGGRVKDALEGIEAAIDIGFFPVKLNMLILKGINDSNVPEMIEFAGNTGTILQLIELEPINMTSDYFSARHKSLNEYETMLKKQATRIETRQYMQKRQVFYLPRAVIETVHPIENTEFCLHCTRLRVTSAGQLKPCLMRNDNTVDILTPMREGASETQLVELFKLANMERRPYNKD
jgi:cyclic pyranopterin phosphate synthase